ncbi:MAG: hypothetical protein V4813_10255 [Gemmatimonadota bacterium]
MTDLWGARASERWHATLDRYPDVIAAQGVAPLAALDSWYRTELPGLISSRTSPHVTLTELVRVTEWKMHRGVWRAPNLVRVKSNDADVVRQTTTRALALAPHPTAPVKEIATLDGVGPATASAITAAVAPETYPFFDELVAAQVPELGPVAWTLGYYAKYAAALRQRAATLGDGWTPVQVERALWAHVNGKPGLR